MSLNRHIITIILLFKPQANEIPMTTEHFSWYSCPEKFGTKPSRFALRFLSRTKLFWMTNLGASGRDHFCNSLILLALFCGDYLALRNHSALTHFGMLKRILSHRGIASVK
jgi:hypothetical protein